MNIIIKNKMRFGMTRSEQERNLRKEGIRTLSNEQLDKCAYLERKNKESTGSKQNFLSQVPIDALQG